MMESSFFFPVSFEEQVHIISFPQTHHAQQPHEGEAGGGIVGPVVELRHLIVLPGLKSVRKESCSLWVQGTDGLFGEGGGRAEGHFTFIQ